MDCEDIIRKHLIDNKYDGLFNDSIECGCELDDLAPCDCDIRYCEPGYKCPSDDPDYDFVISPKKPTTP